MFKRVLFLVVTMFISNVYAFDMQQLVQSPEFNQTISALSKYATKKKSQQSGLLDVSAESNTQGFLQKLTGRSGATSIVSSMNKTAKQNYYQNVQDGTNSEGIQSILVDGGPTRAYSLQMNHMTQQAVITEYTTEYMAGNTFTGNNQMTTTKRAALDYPQAVQLANTLGIQVPLQNNTQNVFNRGFQ